MVIFIKLYVPIYVDGTTSSKLNTGKHSLIGNYSTLFFAQNPNLKIIPSPIGDKDPRCQNRYHRAQKSTLPQLR